MSEAQVMVDDYKYDVAISCLKDDADLAQQLYDLLQPRVRSIFFYPHNQTDLVSRDGLEAFQRVFRSESRVVVIIYREGWGQTRWTAVEETAIKEMCFDAGWTRIVVHSEDGTIPKWLPAFYIWAGKRYGLPALAGVIEQKVQEAGGAVGEEDVEAMAQRIRRSLGAAETREARRSTEEAVHAALRERQAIDARLAELVEKLEPTREGMKTQKASADTIHGKATSGSYTVWVHETALFFRWTGSTVNSMRGDKLILVLGTVGHWVIGEQQEVAEYELELAEDDKTWRWVEGEKGRYYTSIELADAGFRRLLRAHEERRKADMARQRRQ